MSRTRSTTSPVTTGYHGYSHNGSGYSATVGFDSYRNTSITDTTTPNWKRKIKAGEIVNNPMSMSVVESMVEGSGTMSQYQISNPANTYYTFGNGSLTAWFQRWYGSGATCPDPVNNVNQEIEILKTKCLGKIDSTPYAFAEDIGEIRETLKFLKNPLASLITHLKRMRRKTLSRVQKSRRKANFRASKSDLAFTYTDAFADVWLTERFAVAPLIRSISGAMEAYEDSVYRGTRNTARARSDLRNANSINTSSTAGETSFFKKSKTQDVTVSVGLIYEVDHPMSDWQYKYGLRFKDIPETVWNLMSLSFMVDRLINISDSIRALNAFLDPNVSILTAWVVTKNTLEERTSAYNHTTNGYVNVVTPDTIVKKTFSMTRAVWVPTLSDVLPSLNIDGLVDDAAKITDLFTIALKMLVRG
jgi:hypothetical protein